MCCNSKEFKNLFNKNINADKVKNEPNIVKSLDKTIQFYKEQGFNIESSFVHQKYCQYEDKNLQEKPIKRELADLLFVVRSGNIIRYTFIQFKDRSDIKYYKGLNKFKINCGQHHLLVDRPQIEIKGRISNILKISPLDTVTTYSVLYKDKTDRYDFDLASSKSIKCNHSKNTCFKRNPLSLHSYSQLTKKKLEVISHKNIDEIFSNFYFGGIICLDEKEKLDELINVINTFDDKEKLLKVLKLENITINNENDKLKEIDNNCANVVLNNIIVCECKKNAEE